MKAKQTISTILQLAHMIFFIKRKHNIFHDIYVNMGLEIVREYCLGVSVGKLYFPIYVNQRSLLLTWISFNPSVDK